MELACLVCGQGLLPCVTRFGFPGKQIFIEATKLLKILVNQSSFGEGALTVANLAHLREDAFTF